MGLFNFIETFFFISLGVTFVLILLLVYHFKQRMSALEQKHDTMFEIVNNVVKELNTLRNSQMGYPIQQMRPIYEHVHQMSDPSKICVSDSGDEKESSEIDDSESGDDESESGDDESGSGESESDDESESGDDDESVDDASVNNVKIINVEITPNITTEIEANLDEIDDDDNADSVSELKSVDQIHIEKLDQSNDENEHLENSTEIDKAMSPAESSKDVYRKMNLSALKTLVITMGLCSDPSKMKKPELLKMLESNNEA